jgi:hypothetical protein
MEAAIAKSPDGKLHSELSVFNALAAKASTDPQELLPAVKELSALAATCRQLGDSPAKS